nr:mucin-16-like isoform X2 [Equus asinus]
MPIPMAAQGVVPSLVTFFSSLELLDTTMEDYVVVLSAVPPASCGSRGIRPNTVMSDAGSAWFGRPPGCRAGEELQCCLPAPVSMPVLGHKNGHHQCLSLETSHLSQRHTQSLPAPEPGSKFLPTSSSLEQPEATTDLGDALFLPQSCSAAPHLHCQIITWELESRAMVHELKALTLKFSISNLQYSTDVSKGSATFNSTERVLQHWMRPWCPQLLACGRWGSHQRGSCLHLPP